MAGLAKELSLSPAQLALAWILQNKVVSSVITGASRPEQVEENVKASQITLSADTMAKLNEWFPA